MYARLRRRIPVHPSLVKEPDPALVEAIRKELRALLDAEKFDLHALTQISQFAERSHQLLASLDPRLNAVDPCSSVNPGYPSYTDPMEEDSTSNEGYGANMVRQIVSVAKSFQRKDSLVAIVKALAVARENGLDDVAAELQAKIADRSSGEEANGKSALQAIADAGEVQP